MRVLGIDPGSLITGFGVVEDATGVLRALAWGTVRTSSSQPLQVRLKHIYDGLSEALHTWQPEAVAVERVFFAENPKTANMPSDTIPRAITKGTGELPGEV
jgi:crossover junction endodeoxyribonuclease RuvC